MTERRDRKSNRIQFQTESQNVRQPYDVSSRHMQGCRKTVMQNLQDCRKTKRYVVQFQHCSRAVIVRFSVLVVRFAAFLRQLCDKAQGYLAIVLQLSKDKCLAGEILRQSYDHLACLAAVLRQPCVSCGCRTSLRKRKQIEKKMNMSKIKFLTLRQPYDLVCRRAVLSCSILHLEAAARNAEICRCRQVHACRKADVKLA